MYTQLYSNSLCKKMREAKDSGLLRTLADYQTSHVESGSRAYHLRNNGAISFLPEGKQPEYDAEGFWTAKNRQETKIGRAIKAIADRCGVRYTDDDIEKATHILTAVADDVMKEEFIVVSGEDIGKWYNNVNTKAISGTTSTCMVGKGPEILQLYIKNPELVNLVVLTDKKHKVLHGRAILWLKTNHGPIMDRIYGESHVQSVFKKYARENGWAYKVNQSRGEGNFMYHPYTINELREIKIPIITKLSLYPYLDSMMNVYSWGLSSKRPTMKKSSKDPAEMPLSHDVFLGVAVKTDGDLGERNATCHQCGDFQPAGAMARINSRYYCQEHTVSCVMTGNRILKEGAVQMEGGGFAPAGHPHIATINGKHYNGQDANQVCKVNDVWYLAKDCVQNAKTLSPMPKAAAIKINEFNAWLSKETHVQDMLEFGYVQYGGKWRRKADVDAIVDAILKEKEKPVKQITGIVASNIEPEDDEPVKKKRKTPVKKKTEPEEKLAKTMPDWDDPYWGASQWGRPDNNDPF